MADRFDEAKRALEGVPARDVWSEAQRRAGSGAQVVPLVAAAGRGRRAGRRLAAAAAAIVAVGTIAVIAQDDDAPLDAGPGSDSPATQDDVTVYQADGDCKLGIRGGPLPEPRVAPADTFVEGSVGTLVSGRLNETQSYAVQVPGQAVIDLVGERVDTLQLRRGTAQIWFQGQDGPADAPPAGAVQVRWFTGSQDACESFSVTVDGGNEDENRHAAVDLAERVVLPSELPRPAPPPVAHDVLDGTEWFLERTTVGVETTATDEVLLFTFAEGEAAWHDGCNRFSGPYTIDGDILRIGDTTDVTHTLIGCESDPTSEAVHAVMVPGGIGVIVDGEILTLRTLGGELTLAPAGRTIDVTGQPYGIWPMTAPSGVLGYTSPFVGSPEETARQFAAEVLGWDEVELFGEPSHDGRGVGDFSIVREGTGDEVSVGVRAADLPTEGHVIYRVGSMVEHSYSLSVSDGVGWLLTSPPPEASSATVTFIYGEYESSGEIEEHIELEPWSTNTPGAVIVLFEDAAGAVIGAQGIGLMAGDVSIG